MTSSTPPGPATPRLATDGPSAAFDGRAATAGGGIDRLNAFDGLFLRAEHLNRIQDYALELAKAVGQAGGPGVVEGFAVSLEAGKLLVEPGLAIDSQGRPLRSSYLISMPLSDLLATDPDTFWWIEVVSKQWGYEEATVTGTLCDEPCSGGTSAHLFTAEGVHVRAMPDAEVGLGGVSWRRRRSWLASRLFAKEQREASYWPKDPGVPQSFKKLDTAPPTVSSQPSAVRLAVLIPPPPDGGDHQIDMWTARRDRGDPPPARYRQWRLSMRPWDVFVAQVLQFQSTLADRLPEIGYGTARTWRDRVLRGIAAVTAELPRVTKATAQQQLENLQKDAAESFTSAVREAEASLTWTLPELGFDELPPAGYLPFKPSIDQVDPPADQIAGVKAEITLRMPGIDIHVCTARPVDIAQTIQEAQHRDRIPLTNKGTLEAIDVLVPVGEDPETPLFDWVAFVRRDGRHCLANETTQPEEIVALYLIDDSGDAKQHDEDLKALTAGTIPDGDRVETLGSLTYPARTWALPGDEVYEQVFQRIQDLGGPITVIALVSNDDRRPLGAVRAFLLAARFRGGVPYLPELRTPITAGPEEAVVVVLGTPQIG
jgi:hypothetical protein